MIKDEPISFIKEQFDEKTAVLEAYGEAVSSWTMYEDIFGDLEMQFPIVIIEEEDETVEDSISRPVEKHIVPMTLFEALEQSGDRNDMLLGGCTYFSNWISKRSAKDIYTFIVDMDNVYSGTLLDALKQDWYTASGDYLPKPTYIVNSGTGCHLYFVLKEPIPNYRSTTPLLDKLYRRLATLQTTKRVYLKKEVQWFGQDFRMAGGLNKYQWENKAFRVGEKWDIDELAKSVGLNDIHFARYGEDRPEKKSKGKNKRVFKQRGWNTDPAFYEYALKHCKEKTKEGNRYTSMCALSVIAWKCGIEFNTLEKDLKELLPKYNKGAKRLVKEREIFSAMKMYNSKAMVTTRESLENWQGWEYKPIKRNGRKRAEHLKRARAVQMIDYPNGEWRGKKPTAEPVVREWRRKNPDGKKVECIKQTGLSRPTVDKWWNQSV